MAGLETPEQCNAKTESHCVFNAGDILGISTAGKAAAASAVGADQPVASRIADIAKNSAGQELWQGSGLNDGRLGSAASVSNILQGLGMLDKPELSVNGLAARLTDPEHGWQKMGLDQRQPGDVMFTTGSNMRNVGIVDSDGNIMTNHSATGRWGATSPAFFNRPNNENFVLRPKEKQ